jgi:rhodanese-related sulfurtransferase/molybdopterin-guanine dinucleotide biosynthesis protein A
MGTDKAFVELDGVPMVVRVATALRDAGASRVRVIGGDRERLAALGLDAVADAHPGEGPLGGVLTALAEAAPDALVAVLACDLREPSAAAIRTVVAALATDPGSVLALPVIDERPQWLHAVWRVGAARPALTATFEAGERSIWRAVRGLRVREVHDLDPLRLADVDTPDGLTTGGPDARVGTAAPATTSVDGNATVERGAHVDTPEIDVDELARRLADGAVLIDVRRPDEHEEVHLPEARLIPLDQLPDRLDEIPEADEVLVICRSGGRSAAACEFLTGHGVTAVNVAGGMLAWIDSGRPVAGAASAPPGA